MNYLNFLTKINTLTVSPREKKVKAELYSNYCQQATVVKPHKTRNHEI